MNVKILLKRIICLLLINFPIYVYPWFKYDGIVYTVSGSKAYVGYSSGNTFMACIGQETVGEVTIPREIEYAGVKYTVTGLCMGAFYKCTEISKVNLPETIESIGERAFENCSSLISVNIPNSVKSIGKQAFSECSLLETISIPEGVTIIQSRTFSRSGIKSIHIPSTVTTIESYAFYSCGKLKRIEIPSSVTSASYAFMDCRNLIMAVFDELEGTNMFTHCSKLSRIYSRSTSPKGISGFAGISSDATLYVPFGTKSLYESKSGWKELPIKEIAPIMIAPVETSRGFLEGEFLLLEDSSKVLLGLEDYTAFLDEISGHFNVPSSVSDYYNKTYEVVGISKNAFKDCNISSIYIPTGITSIDCAFDGCANLQSITMENRFPSNINVQPGAFDSICGNTTLYVPAGTYERYVELEEWSKFSQIVELGSASLGDLYAKSGGRINLPLYLNNEDPMAGMQYRLTLPEGVSPVLEEGEYLTSLTDRTKTMTIVGRKDPDNDNSYLFAMLSLEGDTVAGNKGALVNLKVEVDENVGLGEYKVELDDVMLVTSSIETFTSPKTSSFFIIKDIVMGDINEDGYIDVADLAAQVRLILGTDNINWIAYAGDMDESGEIEVNDYVALVNTALRQYQTSYLAHERALGLGGDVPSILQLSSLVIDDGEEGDLCLSLSKDSIPYTALQFDLTLPAGVSIVDEGTEAASRKHNVWYEMNTDGTYRVMCASMSNAVFADGDILRLRVKADGAKQGIHEARIDNVVLSDIEAVRYTTGAAKTNIQVGKDTGVSELYKQGLLVSVKNAHLVLTAYSAQHVQIALPNGMEVESLTMEEGEVVYRALPKGVYIVNGKKINL